MHEDMDKFIEGLGEYEVVDYRIEDDRNIFRIRSTAESVMCPYCKNFSTKVHSRYIRTMEDSGYDGRETVLEVITRKMFCKCETCKHTTFAEEHPFAERNMKYTRRLAGNNWGIKKADNRRILCKRGYPEWYVKMHPEVVEPFRKPRPGDPDYVQVPLKYPE